MAEDADLFARPAFHARFDRDLLGKLCRCVWTCIKGETRRLLGRNDVVPGMIAAIQTFGTLLHWNPHIHSLVTCGAYYPLLWFLFQQVQGNAKEAARSGKATERRKHVRRAICTL